MVPMKLLVAAFALWICSCLQATPQPLPVLQRSDVVFMYQASREIYQDYGATVLAWGGTPRPASLEAAANLKFFGSVGMVTEFSRYHERFPTNYEAGLCRDLQGQPYRVPWLTDHQHRGVPYWWCCTRQPVFRTYIRERVVETVKAGAHGVHIDDHLGTAGSLFVGGGCFCERCANEFKEDLRRDTPAGVNPQSFDYPEVLRAWLAENRERKVEGHPLWPRWRAYQLRGAAKFMMELRELAARTAGRPMPMSANACLLWGPHLADFHSLDFFSAEIDHHASGLKFSAAPVVAYRMAEAVQRPLASTASGGDWAFIKEKNLPGLVRGWIALGYAAGHSLMAPNRQWCYTKAKGTHWYEGPKDKFAPLYRFVREHPALFDGCETHADVAIAYAQRTYDRRSSLLVQACDRLTANHVAYSLALGGDDVVIHPLPKNPLGRASRLLVLEPGDFSPADRQVLESVDAARKLNSVEDILAQVEPAVRPEPNAPVRLFPRAGPGRAVVHVLNWDYDPAADDVRPLAEVNLRLQLEKLGVGNATTGTLHRPGSAPIQVTLADGKASLKDPGLWSVLEIRKID